MTNDTVKKLVAKLTEKTLTGEIVWYKTSGENEFKSEFSTSAITVDKYRVRNTSDFHYDLIVYNDRGDVVDRVAYIPTGDSSFSMLMDLYNIVYNSYFKIDKTLDDLFKDLDI